jgi:hypothetical protein
VFEVFGGRPGVTYPFVWSSFADQSELAIRAISLSAVESVHFYRFNVLVIFFKPEPEPMQGGPQANSDRTSASQHGQSGRSCAESVRAILASRTGNPGGGLIFFSLALLISSLVEGEYTAPLVNYGLAIGLAVAFNDTLHAYSPWRFLTGAEYFGRHTSLLTGPIPWMHLAVTVLIAAILMAAAVRVIEKREF